jgi:hypothetical protein
VFRNDITAAQCRNANGCGMKILFLSLLMISIALASHYGAPKPASNSRPQA